MSSPRDLSPHFITEHLNDDDIDSESKDDCEIYPLEDGLPTMIDEFESSEEEGAEEDIEVTESVHSLEEERSSPHSDIDGKQYTRQSLSISLPTPIWSLSILH